MLIASNTPKIIIDVLRNVDTKKIDQAKLTQWLETAKNHIGTFVPKRQGKFLTVEVDLPGVPKEIGYFLNNYDFGKVNRIYIELAKKWIQSNLPMRS